MAVCVWFAGVNSFGLSDISFQEIGVPPEIIPLFSFLILIGISIDGIVPNAFMLFLLVGSGTGINLPQAFACSAVAFPLNSIYISQELEWNSVSKL